MEFKFGDISATALIKMDGNIIEWKYIDSTFEILIGNSLTFTLEEKEDKTRVLAEQKMGLILNLICPLILILV